MVDLTIYTQLSLSRLDQLEQQCLSWRVGRRGTSAAVGAPLSAAVYLPLLATPGEFRGGSPRNSSFLFGGSQGRARRGMHQSAAHNGKGSNMVRVSAPGGGAGSAPVDAPVWYTPSGATVELPRRLQEQVAAAVTRVDGFVNRCVKGTFSRR